MEKEWFDIENSMKWRENLKLAVTKNDLQQVANILEQQHNKNILINDDTILQYVDKTECTTEKNIFITSKLLEYGAVITQSWLLTLCTHKYTHLPLLEYVVNNIHMRRQTDIIHNVKKNSIYKFVCTTNTTIQQILSNHNNTTHYHSPSYYHPSYSPSCPCCINQ